MLRTASPMTEGCELQLLIKALSDLIHEHCPNCLRGISPVFPLPIFPQGQLVIHAQEYVDAKYAIRDSYIRDVLKLTCKNVSGTYYFFIKIDDLLKCPIIQKKLQELRKQSAVEYSSELKKEPLTLPDKQKIAALLNVVFDPFEMGKNIWKIADDNIRCSFINDRYCVEAQSEPIRTTTLINSIKLYFTVSPNAERLGFTQSLLEELRASLIERSSKHCFMFYLNEIPALHACLQIVRNIEQLSGKNIQITAQPDLLQKLGGYTHYDMKAETAQIRQMITEMFEQDKSYKEKLPAVLLEATPFSHDLVNVVAAYTRLFKAPSSKSSDVAELKQSVALTS